jgi:uncharacterized membrane protein
MPRDTKSTAELVARHPSERRRTMITAAIGLGVGLVLALLSPWQVALLTGWDVTALATLGWVWRDIHGLDAEQTMAVATREDDSRAATRMIVVVACVVSLLGVAFALVKSRRAHGALDTVLTIESVVTVVLSWALVHLVYLLRYAHLYYTDPPGGVDFHGDEAPDYGEFAYLAFTIGMTYQVSDTDLGSRAIRRALLGHALLSYLFGTVILALTINLVANLV